MIQSFQACSNHEDFFTKSRKRGSARASRPTRDRSCKKSRTLRRQHLKVGHGFLFLSEMTNPAHWRLFGWQAEALNAETKPLSQSLAAQNRNRVCEPGRHSFRTAQLHRPSYGDLLRLSLPAPKETGRKKSTDPPPAHSAPCANRPNASPCKRH